MASSIKIVIIGAGGVARSLAHAIDSTPTLCLQALINRTVDKAERINARLGAPANIVGSLEVLPLDADLYLLAVSDHAIAPIVSQLPMLRGVVAHTSGSTAVDVLSRLPHYGVFYPLNTFSSDRTVSLSGIPLFIEGCTPADEDVLSCVAKALCADVSRANSEQRRWLHVSAVFACNFTNHLYHISQMLLKHSGLPEHSMDVLIGETVNKLQALSPYEAQTGPAVRKDYNTLQAHQLLLQQLGDSSVKDIYQLITESIIQTHHE